MHYIHECKRFKLVPVCESQACDTWCQDFDLIGSRAWAPTRGMFGVLSLDSTTGRSSQSIQYFHTWCFRSRLLFTFEKVNKILRESWTVKTYQFAGGPTKTTPRNFWSFLNDTSPDLLWRADYGKPYRLLDKGCVYHPYETKNAKLQTSSVSLARAYLNIL